jgi:hypothetical protein
MIAKRAVQAENLSRIALASMMTCMSSVVISANQLRHDEEADTALTADGPSVEIAQEGHEPKPCVALGFTCIFLQGRNKVEALTDRCHLLSSSSDQ